MVIADILEYFPRARLCVLLSFVPHKFPSSRRSVIIPVLYTLWGDYCARSQSVAVRLLRRVWQTPGRWGGG